MSVFDTNIDKEVYRVARNIDNDAIHALMDNVGRFEVNRVTLMFDLDRYIPHTSSKFFSMASYNKVDVVGEEGYVYTEIYPIMSFQFGDPEGFQQTLLIHNPAYILIIPLGFDYSILKRLHIRDWKYLIFIDRNTCKVHVKRDPENTLFQAFTESEEWGEIVRNPAKNEAIVQKLLPLQTQQVKSPVISTL